MKLLILLLIGSITGFSQVTPKPPAANKVDSLSIRELLVAQALQNSDIEAVDANVRIAEYNVKKTKGAWLDAVSANANVNEFVVQNSPAAIYYPKYNLGINVPLSIVSRQNNNLKIAKENVVISTVQRGERVKAIRLAVLTSFENYMALKDKLQLQIESSQELYTSYLKAQKDYAATSIPLEKMNLAYVEYNNELIRQRTAERDLRVAYIELETLVGFKLKDILTQFGIITNN